MELFHQLLLHNWRYFFKSDIVSKLNGADQLQHEQDLLGILKVNFFWLIKLSLFVLKLDNYLIFLFYNYILDLVGVSIECKIAI